jgi:hypothetical protein
MVELEFTRSVPSTFTWHWQHYDANDVPAEPPAGTITFSTDPSQDPYFVPTQPAGKVWNTDSGVSFLDYWRITYLGGFNPSKLHWGDQFVITAIDGRNLAQPITSAIWNLPDDPAFDSCG